MGLWCSMRNGAHKEGEVMDEGHVSIALAESADALRQASQEIARLRAENNVLGAQVFVVETFAKALAYVPPSQGAGVDIAWLADSAARTAQAVRDNLDINKPKVAEGSER